MKKLRYLIALFLMMCIPQMVHAQEYPLDVTVTAKPKFTPILGDFLNNPAKYINISVRGGGTQQEVYFLFKMEQIAPAGDVSIATKAGWRPGQPIVIRATGSTLINSTQISQHFEDTSTNDFNTVGVEIDDYQNYATASTRIPEGVYNLCVYACDFNAPMGSLRPLSNPDSGCTTIKICYKADAPKWIAPAHYSVRDRSRITPDRFIVKPKANIRFQWTAPLTTCGISPSNTTYQLRLVELLEGQTLNDAASNNPPVLIQDDLRMTFYNLDTIRHPNLLERGKNYAAQIVATSNDKILRIQNRGRSEVIYFTYEDPKRKDKNFNVGKFKKKYRKEVADSDAGDQKSSTTADSGDQKSSTTEETDLHAVSTVTDCEIDLPADQEAITDLKVNNEVTIGKFTMTITKINSSNNGVYSGEGSVKANLWKTNEYYTMNAFYVKVKFKDIKVNKNKEVFAGAARAMYDTSSGLNTSSDDFSNDYVAKGYDFLKEKLGKKVDGAVEKLDVDGIGNFTGAAKAISGFSLETSQTLPLNLKLSDKITDNHNIDTGVSDMFFTPTGAMFSMYLFVKIPEENTLLAFGASDLCMYDNPFKNGKLALMANINIPLGTDDYKLIVEGDNKSDEPSKTYVKWTTKGYEGMHLSGRLELPKSQIKNVADPSKPASFNFSASCMDWGDWMANLSMNGGDKFEFVDLEGYHFKIQEAIYDHSNKENPEGLDNAISKLKPLGYKGSANGFKGLYLKRLEAEMPVWITNKGEDAGRVVFALTDAFFDKYGFSMNIAAEDILDVKSGNLGGWGISIDKIDIQLVQSTLQKGSMNGKFEMPILGKTENDKGDKEKGYVNYECLIKKGQANLEDKGKMTYAFRVTPPKDGLSYEFLKYFDAKIKDGSKISVEVKEDKGAKIAAEFNGELNVTVGKKLRFTAIGFEGLRIANFDKNNKPGFDFGFGIWTIGNGKGLDLTGGKSTSVSILDQGHVGGGARLADPELLKWIDEYDKAVKKRAEGNADINKGFHIGPFGASLDKVDYKFKDGDKNFKGMEHTKNIVLDFKTTLSLTDFGGEGDSGKDMAAITTSIGFDIPVGYNMPTTNVDEFFNLEMPKVDFKNIDVHFNEITLSGKFGPVEIYGSAMIFDEDEIYGDGFRGAVSVVLPADIKAYATVQFGEVGEDSNLVKYWYVDAGVNFGNAGLEVGGGTFAINGFGGGVWKNMERTGEVKNREDCKKIDESEIKELEEESEIKAEKAKKAHITDAEKEEMKKVGNAPSGLTYKPVKSGDSAFGFYAKIDYCASKAEGGANVFNGSAKLSSSFKNGGFDEVSLSGDIHVFTQELGSEGMAKAEVEIRYNHPKRFFNLSLDVEGSLGASDFKIPLIIRADGLNSKYYFALGEPEYTEGGGCNGAKTVCLSLFNFGDEDDMVYGHLGAQAYICGGNDIPYTTLPEVPEQITSFLKGDINQYRKNPEDLSSQGFMMGARIDGGFGFKFGPLYAKLEALAGFDVALTKLNGATCSNGDKIEGFGGYYAMGQVYGYLHGDTGVRLKIFGFKKNIRLLDIEAGALMRGGFKDPSWLKGKALIRGSVLNGFITFRTQARFSLGDKCDVELDPLESLEVIEAITPGSDSKSDAQSQEEASVFTSPKVIANVAMNRVFSLVSDDEGKKRRYYKFVIDNVKVEDLTHGGLMEATSKNGSYGIKNNIIKNYNWKENRIIFDKKLKPNTLYKVSVKVIIREKRDRVSGDTESYDYGWFLPKNLKNRPYKEEEATRTKVVYFKTGKLPDYIDKNNIISGFPYEDQKEVFLRNANGYKRIGHIDLMYSREDLFRNKRPEDMYGEFINMSNTEEKIKFSYRHQDGIWYHLPDNLKKNTVYKVRFYLTTQKEKSAVFEEKKERKVIKGGERYEDNSRFGLQKSNLANVKEVEAISKMINSETGESKTIKENATTLKRASINKMRQIMKKKGQRQKIKNIFEYYFHVSKYDNLKDKFRRITFSNIKGGKDNGNGAIYSRIQKTIGTRIRRKNNKRETHKIEDYWENSVYYKYVNIYFPEGTTRDEILRHKTFKGQNARQVSSGLSFVPILPIKSGKEYLNDVWNRGVRSAVVEMIKNSNEGSKYDWLKSGYYSRYRYVPDFYLYLNPHTIEIEGGNRLSSYEKFLGKAIYSSKSAKIKGSYWHHLFVSTLLITKRGFYWEVRRQGLKDTDEGSYNVQYLNDDTDLGVLEIPNYNSLDLKLIKKYFDIFEDLFGDYENFRDYDDTPIYIHSHNMEVKYNGQFIKKSYIER